MIITPSVKARKYSALLLLFVVLHIMTGVYMPQGEGHGLTSGNSVSASIYDADQHSPTGSEEDHKPPKHSFIDYDSLFASHCRIPAYAPPTASHPPHDRPAAHPDVYYDIFVPPQAHA